jgi:hypothetical protein
MTFTPWSDDMPTPDNTTDETSKRRQSWIKHQQAAADVDLTGFKDTGLQVEAMVLRCSWHLREIAQYGPKIEALLSADVKRAYREAWAALPEKLEALHHAHTEHSTNRLVIPGVETGTLQALDKRGKELEELGMPWLKVLVQLGKLPKQTVAAIESGAGYLDRAADLTQIAEHGLKHWKVLDALFKDAEPGTKILTKADLLEMGAVSNNIIGILTRQSGPVTEQGIDWRRQRLGCFVLCHNDWEELRSAARFYFDRIGDTDSHRSLLKLRGMRSFKLRP